MILFVLFFLLGDLYLQNFAELPSMQSLLLISFITVSMSLWLWQYHVMRMCLAFVSGFVFAAYYAHAILNWTLPHSLENVPVTVTGYVKSIPNNEKFKTDFIFALQTITFNHQHITCAADIKLSAYLNKESKKSKKMQVLPQFRAGDQWSLLVRMKTIKANQSPGAFDYEAWALQKGLRATGTILPSDSNQLQHHTNHALLNQLRQSIYTKVKENLPHSDTAHWLLALIIGERHAIPQSQWQVLRNTGTNHLMAIAGLHIGIVAGFAHKLIALLWRMKPALSSTLPVPLASAWAALIVALLYSGLAGFSLPTQRASIMLALFIFATLSKRNVNPWHAYALALLLVLLLNPLNVLTESFWLSFGTIALIIFGMHGRLENKSLWWRWGRVQWVIGFGLIPLSIYFFKECSLTSFLANAIAIPWLAIAILPLCLLSLIFLFWLPSLATFLLALADKSLAALWWLLSLFADLKISAWHMAMPNAMVLMTSMFAFVFLLAPRVPLKFLSCFWLLPLFFVKAKLPEPGHVYFTVLDVGQGLAVVVRTAKHVLIYDTGAKNPAGMDMGEAIVKPYLQLNDMSKIDMMVISHGDNDHMGGSQTLMSHFIVKQVKTSVPKKFLAQFKQQSNIKVSHCLSGQSWQWDGIQFSFLYPSEYELGLGNNSSCVLKVENKRFAFLLTGDIEKSAEKKLLLGNNLTATVITAPHHGSKTSSTISFLDAVQPQHVIYSTGYLNRYHLPDPGIQKLYQQRHVMQYDTSQLGTIEIQFNDENHPKIIAYRKLHKRYWMMG